MRSATIVAGLLLVLARGAIAQTAPGGEDPLARFLFPPDLVMGHQQAIGLSDRQRSAIQQEALQAQAKFTDLQWKMSAEAEKLTRLLSAAPVDEGQVLEQVDRILGIEREVKRTHLSLLIRIKNALSAEQQARLGEIRRQASRERGDGAR